MVPYLELSSAQMSEFLGERRQAVVGVNRVGAPPILSTVWYRYDAGRIYFAIQSTSLKHRLLQRDPFVSVLVDGEYDNMRQVVVYGRATFLPEEETERVYPWIMNRYFDDPEPAHALIDTTWSWGDWRIVTVVPERTLARDFTV